MSRPPHRRRLVVLLVLGAKCVAGFAVLASGLNAISDDDFARVVIAQQWAAAPKLDPTATSWLPLPFWLNGALMAALGRSLDVARSLAFAQGLLAALLVYLAARWLLADRHTALAAGVLAAVLPWSARLGIATVPELPTAALCVLGVAAALIILILDWLVFSAVAESLENKAQLHVAPWKGLLASFYGGIAEEILLRLFMLSIVALGIRYVVGLVSNSQGSRSLSWPVFWLANIIAAVIFGLGHLPATAELIPLTPLVVARAIILNGAIGLVAGFLYWRQGIEMAMICHFSADIVLHVVFPLLS